MSEGDTHLAIGGGVGVFRPRVVSDAPKASYRGDIQGMRAVAVGLVLAWHAGVPWFPGGFVGVDVFFVISGFLMTQLIVAEIKVSGRVSLRRFALRRVRRLLPAAAVCLFAVCLLTWLFLPRGRWTSIAGDAISAGLYVVNWRMADQSVDYLAVDRDPSPVQHFWSLAVEEQFYVLWPVLLLLVAWAARRGLVSIRTGLTVVLLGVVVPSLIWSMQMTATHPERAYFVTTTRLWELGLGGFVVCLATWSGRLPRTLAAGAGWVALSVIVGSSLVIDGSMNFPGAVALVPTLATFVVIVVGPAAGRLGPVAILGTRPMRAVGDLSYSLYLWHWPLLVIGGSLVVDARATGVLTPYESLVIVALSGIPAWLSYRFVEERFRRPASDPDAVWGSLARGGVWSAVSVMCGFALLFAVWPPPPPTNIRDTAVSIGSDRPDTVPMGAEVLSPNPKSDPDGVPTDEVTSIVPDPTYAKSDASGQGCVQDLESSSPLSCRFGSDSPRGVLALVGDSTAMHLLPAFVAMADEAGWVVETYAKSSCPLTGAHVAFQGHPYEDCHEWGQRVLAKLLANPPDVVVTTGSGYVVLVGEEPLSWDAADREMANGVHGIWRQLANAGSRVVVMPSTPAMDFDPAECVERHRDQLTECTRARSEALRPSGARVHKAADFPGVDIIDINRAICPADRCSAVIGGVLVYRDATHLTATYARTLLGHLKREFAPYLGSGSAAK